MTNDWLTGIYLTTDEVLKYPDYVERLRDEIGLNTVVLSFTGQLSEEVLALSPYGGRTPTEEELGELVIRHFDGRPIDPREYPQAQALCGPGVAAQGDDEAFRRAVGQLKEAGLNVWTYGGAWTIRRLMFCPARQDVQDWIEAVCVYWATQYDLDALDITHFRYPMGSFPLGLFGSTCSSCTAAAQELGYDMEAMVEDLQRAREGLRQLDGARLGEVVRLGIGFFDVVHALGLGSGVLDWVRFRCDLVVRNLARFRAAVHAAAPNKAFGTDTLWTYSVKTQYPPKAPGSSQSKRSMVYSSAQAEGGDLTVAEPPAATELIGAYPNPFNPTMAVDYSLHRKSHVRLLVYDMLGRRVAVLEDSVRPEGRYSVRFDASQLPSGAYVLRMETPQIAFTRVLTLLK